MNRNEIKASGLGRLKHFGTKSKFFEPFSKPRKHECFGETTCYSLAFLVPGLLMILALGEYFKDSRYNSYSYNTCEMS